MDAGELGGQPVASDAPAAGDRFAHLSPAARALLARQSSGRCARAERVDGRPVPLSFSQRRVWFFEQITPGTATYNRPKRIRLDGPLDVPALRRAVREIFRRHEVLRSAIDVVDGVPFQRVLPLEADYLQVVSLAPDDDATERWLQVADAEALRPFDLEKGPLARCALVRLSPERHVLLFTASHLAFDGWSTGILCHELGTLYRAFVAGCESPLPDLARQYRDFAADDAAYRPRDRTDRDLAYWEEALRGASPVVRLPRESFPTEPQNTALAPQSVLLPPELMRALKGVSREADATLFMTMFAAFGVLLSRLSGLDDIVIGVPVAGRLRAETEPLLGFFSNTLPLRVRVSAGMTFRALLAQVRQTTLGALEHQELPFDVLVEHLRPERSLEYAPIVQTLFNFRNFAASPLDMGEVQSNVENVVTDASVVELSLDLEQRPDGVLCVAESDRALFPPPTVARWLSHYECVLRAIAANPDEDVTRLPLLTPAERERILVDWNASRTDDLDDTLHGLIEQQVQRTPDGVALVSESGEMTYAELNGRANRLARDLVALGVGPDVLVGVCLERSANLVIALLAVLKAGGAYVPLDPDYPGERLAFMVADAGAPVLLTSPELADRLPAHAGATLHVDAAYWSRAGVTRNEENLAIRCTPDNLVYVIYTSGSTGRPKGAMNLHRGVCNFLLRTCALRDCGPHDAILGVTPASFDTSVSEIFGALICGARVVIARPGGHADPTYVCELIAQHGVTVVYVVPSMLQALLDVADVQSRLATVRLVGAGGEALTPALQERFLAMLPATLRNTYGPTEASVAVTDWRCERGSTRRTVPLGRPFANVRIHILDANGEPTPVGVTGELHIGGVAVGRGYLHRPELTAELFIPDPFSASAGQRLYRTGDLARYDADGLIEYLGRRDHQIKLRGIRIELGEVEAALVAHPDVREAVVIGRENGPGDVRLIAYVVAGDEARYSERALRTHLEKSLTAQMIPSSFVLLDALPLTPSGKLDRRALPVPTLPDRIASEYVAPRTPTEIAIARVWAELFGCERVGAHDNFFELGGHSLLAMRMVSRAHAQGLPMAVGSVFASPTVAQLAALADEQLRSGTPVQAGIQRVSREAYRRSGRTSSDTERLPS